MESGVYSRLRDGHERGVCGGDVWRGCGGWGVGWVRGELLFSVDVMMVEKMLTMDL